jgi:hypothetical protein
VFVIIYISITPFIKYVRIYRHPFEKRDSGFNMLKMAQGDYPRLRDLGVKKELVDLCDWMMKVVCIYNEIYTYNFNNF